MNNTHIINEVIKGRRIIKPEQFTNAIIEDSTINQILENAIWAPTHGRTEPWEFFVFSGEGKLKVAEINEMVIRKITPAESLDESMIQKVKERAGYGSHIIGVAMKRGSNPKIPQIEELLAVGCAVQNMLLTASAYGLGAYWSTGNYIFSEEIKGHFGLGAEDMFLGYIYLGEVDGAMPVGKRNATFMEKSNFIKQ